MSSPTKTVLDSILRTAAGHGGLLQFEREHLLREKGLPTLQILR